MPTPPPRIANRRGFAAFCCLAIATIVATWIYGRHVWSLVLTAMFSIVLLQIGACRVLPERLLLILFDHPSTPKYVVKRQRGRRRAN
jgi:hypothetical protein